MKALPVTLDTKTVSVLKDVPSMNALAVWGNYNNALQRYVKDFAMQTNLASHLFFGVERERFFKRPLHESIQMYSELMSLNSRMFMKALQSSTNVFTRFHMGQFYDGIHSMLTGTFPEYLRQQTEASQMMVRFGKEIQEAREKYGFHFDDGNYKLIADTPRFWQYQVFPFVDGQSVPELVDDSIKPVVVIPPYVLGANILCFLRDYGKSYVHSFANRGIPTYVRIIKPIDKEKAVVDMTQEDDCRDTAHFCDVVYKKHNRLVTLNGYCQGGYGAVANWLSGELDETVDAVVTCVAPMDGTYSKDLKGFLDILPPECNDLAYGMTKTACGSKAASGELMSWVYKIKSLDDQAPVVAFYNDLAMMLKAVKKGAKLSPTAAALNYWLTEDRVDIPKCITDVSFISYNVPVTKNGTLPVRLFGKKLNLRRFKEKGATLAHFYAKHDDLVEKEVALATAKYATYTEELGGGHVRKATTPKQETGGPERYHLSLS